MNKIGFAIVGCGMISKFHANAIEALEDAYLAGVYDPVPASMERASKLYGVPGFESMAALLACEDVDAVCVCTPNGLHAPIAMQILNAGKHVVIEKPMALTLADADAIIAAAKKRNLCVCVISQLRFSPAVQAVKKAVEDGMFGKIVSASLSMKYWRDEAYFASSGWRGTWKMDGGGALMNQGIHGVDLLQYLVGSVKNLTALCKTQTRPVEVEDSAVAILEFANGAVGTLDAFTTCCPGYPRRLEICGDQGSIVLQEEDILRWDLPGKKPDLTSHGSAAASDPSAISNAGHIRQLGNMVKAIRGEEALLVDAVEGRKPVEIILSIYESSDKGVSIALKGESEA